MARQELVTLSQEVCSRLPLNEAVWHYAPASLKKEARRVAKLEYAMPRQQAFEAVREHAHKHLNANIGIGYSDETIQRELLQIVGKRR
jgi:hypothetical protein